MKKKVLYGVVMALVAGASMTSLQSCKDDLADFRHEYAFDQTKLQATIGQLRSDLEAAKAECDARIADLQAQITANDGDIADLYNKLAQEVADREALEIAINEKLGDLETSMKAYADAAAANAAAEAEAKSKAYTDTQIASLAEDFAQQIEGLQVVLTNLNNLLNDEVERIDAAIAALTTSMEQLVSELQEQIGQLSNVVWANVMEIDRINADLELKTKQLEAIESTLKSLGATVDANSGKIAQLTEDVTDLKKKYDALQDQVDAIMPVVEEYFNTLDDKIALNANQIARISQELDDLQQDFNKLVGRLDAFVTGILIQGTDTPVFGSINTPLGIRSNILFNWWGKNTEAFTFPTAAPEHNYNGEASLMTEADLAFLKNNMANAEQFATIPAGYLTSTKDQVFNIGRLYMTVNPTAVDFTGKEFSLETSAGRKLPFTMDIVKSDDELSFGYTKAAGNGFYHADVAMPANQESIDATNLDITTGLEDAAKDFVKNASKRTALELLTAVFDQVNNKVPAYAVRCDWQDGDKENAVLSHYDLAVATARPLSYKFLEGVTTSKSIRTFGHIDNFVQTLKEKLGNAAKINVDATTTINGQSVKLVSVENFETTAAGDITATVNMEINGAAYHWNVNLGNDAEAVMDELNKAIVDNVCNVVYGGAASDTQKAEAAVKLSVVSLEVQNQLSDVLAEIQGKIDSVVDNAFDKFEPYGQRLNKIIDLYNKVAGKINAFLANPNEYLQPALLYKASGKVGLLSCDKNSPTVFVNGGGQAFNLFLTSYTGEIIAPAYQKFVACTNVYNAAGQSVRDAHAWNLGYINNHSSGLNRVISGKTYMLTVPATTMQAGLTYEFAYQCVDWHGVTSTRKFYITVK